MKKLLIAMILLLIPFNIAKAAELKMNKLIRVTDNKLALSVKGKALLLQLEQAEKQAKAIKKALKEEMEVMVELYGIDKYEDDDIRITYIYPTTKSSFNQSLFKKDNPMMFNDYLQES